MKKFFQASSFLGFLVLFASLSVSAQRSYHAEVDIPFPFLIGESSYESGKYNFRIENALSGSRIFTLTDEDDKVLKVTFIHINGEKPADNVRMVFDKIGDKRFLSKIRTSTHTFALIKSKKHRDEIERAKETETLLARGN